MKHLILLLSLSLPLSLWAQRTIYTGSGFSQFIDISAYKGQNFRVSAAIRTVMTDTAGGADIWMSITKADGKVGFYTNMSRTPVRDSVWKVYTLSGRIDKTGKTLSFGGEYDHKGLFYFDNFHVYVQAADSSWQEIPILNQGWEADEDKADSGWFFWRTYVRYPLSLIHEGAYEGHSALLADGVNRHNYTPGSNDTAGHYVNVNGIRLYYEKYGQGPPLLLLHGNSSSINSFYNQIPALVGHYTVIAVDTRGQGKSSKDDRTYTYDLFAEDMKLLLDSLRLDSVDVLGWSDGGNTGLIMAMKYPSKVRRLAVMGAVVFIDNTVVDKSIFKALRKEQEELKNDTFPGSPNRSQLIELLLTEPRHTFDELKAIQCPVLVMAGEYDVVKEGHTRGIAEHITGSKLLIFKGGDHYEPEKNPKEFNATVLDFFAGK